MVEQLTLEQRVKEAVAIVNKVKLPIIPSEVLWLKEALADENTNFFDIIKRLETQSAIVEETISTANQVLIKYENPVTTIGQAVNFLGSQSLYHLVLSAHLKHAYEHNPISAKVLEHSIWVAKAMTLIERRLQNLEPDFAYTIGLFHNLGALALSLYDPGKYDEFFQQSKAFPLSALQKEEVRYGTNHCLLGMVVGKKWRLPKLMLELIYRHHVLDLQTVPAKEMRYWVARLRLANSLVDQVCYEIYRTTEIRQAEEEALAYLNLTGDAFGDLKHDFVASFLRTSRQKSA